MNWQTSQHNPPQNKTLLWIIIGVLTLHFLFIGVAILTHTPLSKKVFEEKPRFIVQTVPLSSPPSEKVGIAPMLIEEEAEAEIAENEPHLESPKVIQPSKPLAPKPVKKPLPPLKKEAKLKTPPVKKSEPVKKVQHPPKAPPVNKALEKALKEEKEAQEKKLKLISEAQERIAKIGKNRDKSLPQDTAASQVSAIPHAVTSLTIDELEPANGLKLSDKEQSYRDEIAGRLKLLLRLPQYGAVKVKMTLDKLGKVVNVTVLHAENQENKKHIEKTLPTLTFPSPGHQFGTSDTYTLTITLRNE